VLRRFKGRYGRVAILVMMVFPAAILMRMATGSTVTRHLVVGMQMTGDCIVVMAVMVAVVVRTMGSEYNVDMYLLFMILRRLRKIVRMTVASGCKLA